MPSPHIHPLVIILPLPNLPNGDDLLGATTKTCPSSPTKKKLEKRRLGFAFCWAAAALVIGGSILAILVDPNFLRPPPPESSSSRALPIQALHAGGRPATRTVPETVLVEPETPTPPVSKKALPPIVSYRPQALMEQRFSSPPERPPEARAQPVPPAPPVAESQPEAHLVNEPPPASQGVVLLRALSDQVRLGSLSKQDFERLRQPIIRAMGARAGASAARDEDSAEQAELAEAAELDGAALDPSTDPRIAPALLNVAVLPEQRSGFLIHAGQEVYMLLDRTNNKAAATGRVVQTLICKPPCRHATLLVKPLSGTFDEGASSSLVATQLAKPPNYKLPATEEQITATHAKFLGGPAIQIKHIQTAGVSEKENTAAHTLVLTSTVLNSERVVTRKSPFESKSQRKARRRSETLRMHR